MTYAIVYALVPANVRDRRRASVTVCNFFIVFKLIVR
jgi:hypothetical protein